LTDALWGDHPPADAETALRVRMREVRRALQAPGRLVTHRSGYQIMIQPGELDVASFRSLAAHGRAALDIGCTEDAARLLGQACRLWRDPPLADLPDTPLMGMLATALLEQRRDAEELLMDARLALGQHHEVLAGARELIAAEALREHPHVQLMLALYRCGQKAAALAAYTRLRELTVREFGQDPGPEAQALLAQILSDSPDLMFRPRLVAVSAAGRPAWAPVCQLPAPPPDFTGRVAAIEALARRLPAADLAVTVITGPPGSGKTALAVRAAHLASGKFPDGQLFAALGGPSRNRQPLDILGELLRSLGVPPSRVPEDLAERAALYRSVLAGRRVLVLADDAATAAQVRPLLPGTAGSAVLVTSSSRLADLEGASCLSVSGLDMDEAVVLLGKIAGKSRVEAEPAAAAAIVSACAGLPLALRIAGARLAADPGRRLADLAAAVSDTNRLLGELAIGDLSVSRRLDRAWRALDPSSQQALRTLAQAGPHDLPDSVVLSAAAGATSVAQALRDSGLIVQNPETGHYRIAPLAGWHAAAQPVPSTDEECAAS
jgi:DNA-binding SARP family transcriptional activator/energy-coupling factor transporter ATP-binding protein EcfA2